MTEPPERLAEALKDRYRIERELGAGGMATVYLAEDPRHGRKVALKVLRPDLAATLGPERFLREVTIAANLQHPHILPVYDSGEAAGFLYYVMPFVEGPSLRDRLVREHELPVAEAARILRDVADAMAAAHAAGVVHRDIKPENILLSGRHALVADFGVAKAVSEATGRQTLTTVGVALGTPTYMAPEQAAADPHTDHRADLYALGVMAYEMLTGQAPFVAASPQAVLAAHATEAPVAVTQRRATIPAALAQVVMRCLEKKPADRPQSAEELLPVLEALATPSGGITPAQMQPIAGVPATRRLRWPVAVTVVVLLAATIGIVLATRGSRDAGESRDAAAATPANGTTAAAAGFIVLPFVNQTGVDSLEAFGAVVADYLTSQVSRNAIGWVTPSQTVRELAAGQPEGENPTSYYSEQSGARYVVTGSYFQQSGSLVLQAEVTDAAASALVASVGPIEGQPGDFMAVAQAGAEQIMVALARILDPLAAPPRLAGAPTSFAAYRDFMEGSRLWSDGERERALELFYRALDADSTYAEALLWASTTEWNLGDIPKADSIIRVAQRYRNRMAPWDLATLDWLQGWFDGDREAVYRAGRRWAELDPVRGGDCRGARMANRLHEAVEACLKWYDRSYDRTGLLDFFWTDLLVSLHLLGEHETELEHARTARRFNPGTQQAFIFEASALAALGRVDELRSLLDEARGHGTEFSVGAVIRQAGLELRAHGRREPGDVLIRESLDWYREHDLTNNGTAWSLFASGDFEATRALCDRLLSEDAEDLVCLGLLGSAAAAQGDREAARRVGARLVEIEERPYVFGSGAQWHAMIVAQLGDRDEAVRLLQVAYEAGMSYGSSLHLWPQLDGLRDYPPFERFIAPKD